MASTVFIFRKCLKPGKEEGAKAEKNAIAKNLLNIGTSKEDIIKVTGLSVEELEELKKEM